MAEENPFLPLKDCWDRLFQYEEGSKLHRAAVMYGDAAIWSWYEFQRIYQSIIAAAELGPLTLHFTKQFWRTNVNNDQTIRDRHFHNVSSIEQKRQMILAIIERDEVVAPFLTLIDKGDELILEIREPDDATDET